MPEPITIRASSVVARLNSPGCAARRLQAYAHLAAGLALVAVAACTVQTQKEPTVAPPQKAVDPGENLVVSSRILTTNGGRLDWCHARNLIAFDRVTSRSTTEVFVISPDGSNERCVTCSAPLLPKGVRGQPAWHPSCEFMVIQAQGEHYQGSRFEFVSWGIHNDLWLVADDGRWTQKLVSVEKLGASLHPHFSDNGERLFWTARRSTGRKIRQRMLDRTPGGENPWDGWYLSIARFVMPVQSKAQLLERVNLYEHEGGFYESHALRGNTIWFSHTTGGRPFVDDVYYARADGAGRINITRSPSTWEEHVEESPGGRLMTFNSSRAFDWRHPPDLAASLRLELWARRVDTGQTHQLTRLNERAKPGTRILTSDYAWGPGGQEIAFYYATFGEGQPAQTIEILRLDRRY